MPFPAERWASFEALWSVLAATAPVPTERAPAEAVHALAAGEGRGFTGVQFAEAFAGVQRTTREAAPVGSVRRHPLTDTRPAARAVGELRDDEDPAADFAAQVEYTPWTSVWNLTGWPAISLPLHRVEVDGTTLPVGVMLGGRHGSEATLLALSAQLERARPWREALPTVRR